MLTTVISDEPPPLSSGNGPDPSQATASISTAALLDPFAAWDQLNPALQRRIGAATVAMGIGSLGISIAEQLDDVPARHRHLTSNAEALSLLLALIAGHVLRTDDEVIPPWVDLRPLGIRQCKGCGCTDDFACEGGCAWVTEDLCSRCPPADPQVMP